MKLLLEGLVILGVVFLVGIIRSRGRQKMDAEQLNDLKNAGAQFIDVRTPAEFQQGHARRTRNVPLDELAASLGELDRSRPVVVCCASGARSAAAKALLEKEGFAEVHNAGAWQALVD
jgi:rhodanese-related sulfurtransferase